MSEQPPGVREFMAVYGIATVNASRLAALEAVAKAAEELFAAKARNKHVRIKLAQLQDALAKLREVR